MLDNENAALVEPIDAFVNSDNDHITETETLEATTTESAPVDDTQEPAKTNGIQERINKITADKHEERRRREAEAKRADDLQAKLDELEAKKPTLTKPTLEDYDYDDEAFNQATVNYQVQEQVAVELANQRTKQSQLEQKAKQQQALDTFNERALALAKDDFADKANAIPELPVGVAGAIIALENGAEMVYHLGTHLDKADALASMSPMAAMMEVGRISTSMSVKPEIKLSAAPSPIQPIKAGSSIEKSDDEMSIAEFMAKHG